MSKIFINYRREDSTPYAVNLYHMLIAHFGDAAVFMDIDQIKPGEVFSQKIQQKLQAVQLAIVLIGKQWLNITDDGGQRRLEQEGDWVRLEIASLLERNIYVIPVLVGGATMPKVAQLPACLAALAERQAHTISDQRFRADVDKLIRVMNEVLQAQDSLPSEPTQPTSPQPPHQPPQPPQPSHKNTGLVIGLVLAGVMGAGYLLMGGEKVIDIPDVPAETSASPLIPASTERLSFEPEMVRILPGKFLMGSSATDADGFDDERPQHEVMINYTFEISKYEVTFDEYDAFVKDNPERESPSDNGWGRGKQPVINVSFDNVQAYVQWLSKKTDKKYRLPTEAEWEYAARAGQQTRYWWGDAIGSNNANCRDCGSQWDNKQTAPVGSFKANAFGLYDTAGNVWEWTQDCWHVNYTNAPTDGSAWLDKNGGDCSRRVVRGGSWYNGPQGLRSAFRGRNISVGANDDVGFRVARVL